jgi:hypothetical protein
LMMIIAGFRGYTVGWRVTPCAMRGVWLFCGRGGRGRVHAFENRVVPGRYRAGIWIELNDPPRDFLRQVPKIIDKVLIIVRNYVVLR